MEGPGGGRIWISAQVSVLLTTPADKKGDRKNLPNRNEVYWVSELVLQLWIKIIQKELPCTQQGMLLEGQVSDINAINRN